MSTCWHICATDSLSKTTISLQRRTVTEVFGWQKLWIFPQHNKGVIAKSVTPMPSFLSAWRHVMFPWQFWHTVYLRLMPVYSQVSWGDLFSKSPQPCVLVCIRKTKIKSPQCEIYLHPWHLDMARVFPKHCVACISLSLIIGVKLGDFYSETLPQRQKKALWAKRKTMAINTTDRLVS